MPAASTSRNALVDFLRLAAALAVVGFHYFFRGSAGPEPMMNVEYPVLAQYAIFGYLGVNLFFLISGFVIAWSAEGRTAIDFGISRFVRIYPGFLACMTISFAILLVTANPVIPVSFGQFFANLAIFAPALGQPFVDGVYWSIVIELVFYGWVTLAVATGMFSAYRLEFIAAMLLLSAINESLVGSGAIRLMFVTEFAPLFALGMLAQFIHARGATYESLLLSIAAILLSFAHLTITRDWMAAHYGVALSNIELVASNIVVLALFVASLSGGTLLRSSALTVAIGGLTYPLYLMHQNIGYLLIPQLEPFAGATGSALAVTAVMIAASWFIWRHVERPAQSILRRFAIRSLETVTGFVRQLTILVASRQRP